MICKRQTNLTAREEGSKLMICRCWQKASESTLPVGLAYNTCMCVYVCMYVCMYIVMYSKVNPITGHEGPEVKQRYSSTLSLTSALDGVGGQRHAPAALAPRKTRYHCIGGWVGPRTGLDECGKFRPQRDSISGPSSP